MKRIVIAAIAAVFASTAAFADEKPSAEEAAKLKEAVAAQGCEGGEYEKEAEASGYFEVDDAKCEDGKQYDLKFDKDFKLLTKSPD